MMRTCSKVDFSVHDREQMDISADREIESVELVD